MNAALLVAPDFLLIALGALLARRFAYGPAFWEGVERLVYFVLFPALLFRSLATAPLAIDDAGGLALVAFTYTGGAMLLSALAKPLFRLPRETFAACFQCGFRFNTYLALAVAARFGGPEGVALASLVVGLMVPFVNLAAVAMLAQGRASRIALEVARNPLVIATVAGIAWNALALPLPAMPDRLLKLGADGALPLGLLAVGAALRFERDALPLPALAWFHAVKLAAAPAIAFGAARALGLPLLETQIALVHASVPTATSAYILASRMNGRGAPVALIISTGTLLAVVTMPLWLALVA
ncbi:MAG TPA: AEC family transporter [Casimicrobiaceae bacterium]|nr:AEC family transporter [Casimicrobiaceae bacterium]